MEMHQVRYFLAAAEELNFSRAAEKCNVSQPSLSRAIQQLEGELGGRLFHRERHFTHLTDLGQMIRPHLEIVYGAAVKAKRLSQDLSELKRVPLKLGIMSTTVAMAAEIAAEAAARFELADNLALLRAADVVVGIPEADARRNRHNERGAVA